MPSKFHFMNKAQGTLERFIGKQKEKFEITVPRREGATTFYNWVAAFDKSRKFEPATEESGIGSERGEHYQFPSNSDAEQRAIQRDEDFILGLNIQPDDVFEIEHQAQEDGWDWKPFRVELYGFTRSDLDQIARDAWERGRLVKVASCHGASHSFAMLIKLLQEDRVPLDFVYYTNLPNELPNEKEFVLYYTRHLLGQKVVVVVPQDSAETYYYRAQLLPKPFARWCTSKMKLMPYKYFLKAIFQKQAPKRSHVDLLQFLGMQRYQSPGRARLNAKATPNIVSSPMPDKWATVQPTVKTMFVYDMLPVFDLSHEDNLAMIASAGGIRSFNERKFGRHGCVTCPFATPEYYFQLKTQYPKLYRIACKRRDLASAISIEKGYLKEPWTQYRLTKGMKEMGLKETIF